MSALTMTPRRIQLSRERGWRMPAGAVSVARPTRWGNPYRVKPTRGRGGSVDWMVATRESPDGIYTFCCEEDAIRLAVALYRSDLLTGRLALDLAPLRGHDLACWCPLSWPCHADVLLELANSP
jgi:hypothetical protein